MTNRQLFLQHLAQTSDFPLMLEIERAEGVYLYDKEDKPYIDLIAGIGVSNVGHRHPLVVAAIKEKIVVTSWLVLKFGIDQNTKYFVRRTGVRGLASNVII